MVISNPKKPARPSGTPAKKTALGRAQVTTIRIREDVQAGLRILEAHSGVKRPLNKWVNLALADFIDRQIALIEESSTRPSKTSRLTATDPGYKKAFKAFIDAEVARARDDPMEGASERPAVGPAVSMVREILRG